MKKVLLFLSFFVFAPSLHAQDSEEFIKNWKDSVRQKSNDMFISELFDPRTSECGRFLGITNSYELQSYYVGGEFKIYDSYYLGILSGSLYTNFRTTVYTQNPQTNFNSVSIGGHFMLVGLEGTVYFIKSETLFYLTPKLGYDNGGWSLFYGYSLPLLKAKDNCNCGHNISLKYHLYLNAFKRYKYRKKSWGY